MLYTQEHMMVTQSNQPGYGQSLHYSEYTGVLKALLLARRFERAKELSEPLLNTMEAEAQAELFPPNSWHYQQLPKISVREGSSLTASSVLKRYTLQARRPPQARSTVAMEAHTY
jgi:hypothetical protein